MADRWRYGWHITAPRGAFSPAAVRFMGRISNQQLTDTDMFDWVRLEDEYCRTARDDGDDLEVIRQAMLKIGTHAGRRALQGMIKPLQETWSAF